MRFMPRCLLLAPILAAILMQTADAADPEFTADPVQESQQRPSGALASWSGTEAGTITFQAKQRWELRGTFSAAYRIDYSRRSDSNLLAQGSLSGDKLFVSNLAPGDYEFTVSTNGQWEIDVYPITAH